METSSLYINESMTRANNDETPLISRSNWKSGKFRVYSLIYPIDILLSLIFFGPLVSIYWNFSWEFLDLYFYVSEPILSNLICWIFGLLIIFPAYLFQKDFDCLDKYFQSLNNFNGRFLKVTLRISYIYSITLGVLLQWRGLWNLIDIFFFKDWKSQLVLSIICFAFLIVTRATKILLSNPFILYRDNYSLFYTGVSRHKFEIPDCPQFSFDFVLCELVECLALTSAWKGLDNLCYEFIFPNDDIKSLIASFLIGHVSFFILLIVQHFLFKQTTQLSLFPRLIIEDFLNILMFLSAVVYWKFYWDIMEIYIFKTIDSDRLYYLLIIGHFISFIISFSLKTAGLLIGPGVRLLDGEFDDDAESFLDIEYLKNIYQKQNDENISTRVNIQEQG
ncbi:unnamed protein product [Brachionus calyciflorus]|uniref:Uncharacterized protein n=1 Tax=Brachionus calyciflorus TaxID=104777 RepID=A0A813QUM8_9BILA|nr:unnamed protein product [Brachionus calyciflorus]